MVRVSLPSYLMSFFGHILHFMAQGGKQQSLEGLKKSLNDSINRSTAASKHADKRHRPIDRFASSFALATLIDLLLEGIKILPNCCWKEIDLLARRG
uniref:Uncharacterized protein n=2 Tax=Picea TaxID=3328 RepID=A0A124GMM4_PICGL|nr:hypothetical protein ABT39_MTgene1939 [Picea glauca]QHR89925.1 hypothetical protein Q903MT_gene3947 [Picea sitchensis]